MPQGGRHATRPKLGQQSCGEVGFPSYHGDFKPRKVNFYEINQPRSQSLGLGRDANFGVSMDDITLRIGTELVVTVCFIATSSGINSIRAGKSRVNPTWNSGNWWEISRTVTSFRRVVTPAYNSRVAGVFLFFFLLLPSSTWASFVAKSRIGVTLP